VPHTRAKLAAALTVVAALHVCLRLLSTRTVLASDHGLPWLTGSDAYQHAHRIKALFARFPGPLFHDPAVFHPDGTIVEWPLGMDWPVAAALRLVSAFGPSWGELVWTLPFVPVVLSVFGLVAFYLYARRVFPTWGAVAASLAFAVSMAGARVAVAGELDHHVQELTGVALLLLVPSFLERPGRATGVLGFALALIAWSTTLFAYVVAAFLAVALVVALVRKSERPQGIVAFGAGLVVTMAVLFGFEAFGRGTLFSVSSPSLLAVIAVAAPALGLALIGRVPRKGIIAGLVATPLAVLVVAPESAMWALTFIAGWDPFFGAVGEAKPLLFGPEGPTLELVHRYFGFAWLAFPLAFIVARRSKRLSPTVLTFAILLFFASFAQRRFIHLFVPVFIPVIFVAAETLFQKRGARGWGIAVALLFMVEPAAVGMLSFQDPISPTTRASVALAAAVREVGVPPGTGVHAPPNAGNAINFVAGAPAVTNTFFYRRYLSRDLALRSHETDEALVADLRAHRIGVLVAVDDVRYRTMLLRLFDDPRADESADDDFEPCTAPHLRFAFYRLACGEEESVDGLTRVRTMVLGRGDRSLLRRAAIFTVDGSHLAPPP